MAQRQKLAVEREKLQAELEHFRKCLTLPQTPHWPRGSHYKGYPPRWPRHANQMAPRPMATNPFWLTPRVYSTRLGPPWLAPWNEWMNREGWAVHGVAAHHRLCRDPPTRANVANPQDLREYGAGTHTRTRTHLLFTVFSPCCSYVRPLPPSTPQTKRQSCQWGRSYSRRGVVKGTGTLQKLLASLDR